MNNHNTSNHPSIFFIRLTARLASLLFVGVFILMFIGEGFEPVRITPREWISLFFFPFGLITGLALAWWKDGLGGAIALFSTIIGMAVSDASGPGGGYMLVCASPALLFILSWFLSQSSGSISDRVVEKELIPEKPTAEILERRQTRIESGQCPKCGAKVNAEEKNCPHCRINLAFARAHLDAW